MFEQPAENSDSHKLIQKKDTLYLGLFLLGLFLLFSGNLLSRTYPVDPLWIELGEAHMPHRFWVRECLKLGRFPLWLPNMAFGYPNIAHSHATPFYPPFAVFYILSFLSAATVYITFHIILLGSSFYFLLKRLQVTPASALFGASGLASSAYLLSNTGYHPFFLTLSWSPLIILVSINLVNKITIGRLMALALSSALQFFSGDLEFIVYQWTLFITASIAYRIIWKERKINWTYLTVPIIFAGGIALLLVCIQFVPLLELFSQSDREVGFSLLPIKGRILEGIYRYADGLLRLIFPFTLANHYYNISFVIFALGIWGLIKTDKKTRAFFIFILLFCHLNAVQHYSPLQRFFSLLPGLKGFRFPSRLAFFFLTCFCVLASMGFDNLLREKAHKRFFLLIPIGMLIYAVAYYFYGPYRPISAALVAMALILGTRLFESGHSKSLFNSSPIVTAGLVILAFLFDPLFSGVKILPRTPKSAIEPFPEVVETFKKDKSDENYPRSVMIDFFPEGRFRSGQEVGLGGFTIACFYSLYPKRYFWWHSLLVPKAFEFADDYLAIKQVSTYYFMFHYDQKNMLKKSAVPWLKLAGVKRLILRGGNCEFCSLQESPDADYLLTYKGNVDIYETDGAYPRVFYGYSPIILDDMKSVFNYMRANPEIDFHQTVLLEKGYASNYEKHFIPQSDTLAPRILEYLPDALSIDVSDNGGAYLILTDSYYPGWRAYVDGVERKIIPADGLFRSLLVGKENKRVTFKYQPVSFRIGLWVSIIGGLSFLAFLVIFPFKKLLSH